MRDFGKSDGLDFDLGSMSDRELCNVYIRAIGLPSRRFGGHLFDQYRQSYLRRVLTACDAIIFLAYGLVAPTPLLMVACAIGFVGCLVNLMVGPLSLGVLLIHLCLDLVPSRRFSSDRLPMASPESISLITDFLAAPLIKDTAAFVASCQEQVKRIDHFLAETAHIRSTHHELQKSELYSEQIENAKALRERLEERREEVLRAERLAEQEVKLVGELLQEMRALGQASYQLRVVKSFVLDRTQQVDEESARRRFENIRARLRQARGRLSELQETTVAPTESIHQLRQISGRG